MATSRKMVVCPSKTGKHRALQSSCRQRAKSRLGGQPVESQRTPVKATPIVTEWEAEEAP